MRDMEERDSTYPIGHFPTLCLFFNFPILCINPFPMRWAGGLAGCLGIVEVCEANNFEGVESSRSQTRSGYEKSSVFETIPADNVRVQYSPNMGHIPQCLILTSRPHAHYGASKHEGVARYAVSESQFPWKITSQLCSSTA